MLELACTKVAVVASFGSLFSTAEVMMKTLPCIPLCHEVQPCISRLNKCPYKDLAGSCKLEADLHGNKVEDEIANYKIHRS